MDTQGTLFFSQEPSIYISDLELDLPCNPSTWEADTAEQWQEFADIEEPSSNFQSILQNYIADTPYAARSALNALSHVLVLYGLIAIMCETKQRSRVDMSFLGCFDARNIEHQHTASLELWKVNFDMYRFNSQTALGNAGSSSDAGITSQFRSFVGGATVLYHMAHVFLNAPIVELQKHIGASSLAHDTMCAYLSDQRGQRLRAWASQESASYAVWHAGHAIREAILELRVDDGHGIFGLSWSLYIAALACISFSTFRLNDENISLLGRSDEIALKVHSINSNDGDVARDTKNAIAFVVSQMTNLGPDRMVRAFTAHQARTICVGVRNYAQEFRCQMLSDKVTDLATYSSRRCS